MLSFCLSMLLQVDSLESLSSTVYLGFSRKESDSVKQ